MFGKAFNLLMVKLRSKRYFIHKFSSYRLIISQHCVYVTFLSSKKKKRCFLIRIHVKCDSGSGEINIMCA